MISANQLPPERSVYEAPAMSAGQTPTPEQAEQITTAQIAGIVVGVAALKSAIEAAVTNQIVALLHSADLATKAGIKAFATAAAEIVLHGVRQAQEATWAGVKMRAEAVGVDFQASMPSFEDIPKDLRGGRRSDLVSAYSRLATEYQENLERDEDDPVIKELVEQFIDEGITPLPRPDNISSDAVERIADGEKAEWTEAFQEAIENEGGEVPEEKSDEEISEDSLLARREEAERRRAEELEKFTSLVESARNDRRRSDERDQAKLNEAIALRDSIIYEEQQRHELTKAEIDSIVRRYAEHKAGERAERMVSQDVRGASRNIYSIAINSIKDGQVLGYRRVIHPELAESKRSCGLCIVASTMEYKKGDLLPIHSGCNCETCEIYSVDGKVYDPGHQINMEDLQVFYREAGSSTHGWDLKKSRYKVVDHPEYGPTLYNDHPNKTGKKKKEYVQYND